MAKTIHRCDVARCNYSRPVALCGYVGGDGLHHSPVTHDSSKVTCKRCLKGMEKHGRS